MSSNDLMKALDKRDKLKSKPLLAEGIVDTISRPRASVRIDGSGARASAIIGRGVSVEQGDHCTMVRTRPNRPWVIFVAYQL